MASDYEDDWEDWYEEDEAPVGLSGTRNDKGKGSAAPSDRPGSRKDDSTLGGLVMVLLLIFAVLFCWRLIAAVSDLISESREAEATQRQIQSSYHSSSHKNASSGSSSSGSSSGNSSAYGSSGRTGKSGGAGGSSRKDEYNAADFANADDFYDEYYDDFFDYYDAEEYWDEYN